VSAIFDHAAELWHQCRADYDVYLEAAEHAAELATNGYAVNDRGRARGYTLALLMTSGPLVVRAYATPELLDHLAEHPRITFATYERAWFDDRHAR
jgi:hypothetical protein